jgi:MFS family permease
MASILKSLKWLYNEFGIASIYHTGSDAWFMILARSCRMFAYGGASLILALFFSELEFSDTQIGIFMGLTLVGDVALSLVCTLVADNLGRRKVLFLGAILMIASGAIFSYFENFWILLFAAVLGVISASGADIGPFRSIEESTLSHLTTPQTRSDVLSWYVTTAALGSALGSEFSGRLVDHLQDLEGWTVVNAYHTLFLLYMAMGVMNLIFISLLSAKCEAADEMARTTAISLDERRPANAEASEALLDERGERAEDVDDNADLEVDLSTSVDSNVDGSPQPPEKRSYFSHISSPTLWTMYKLWSLILIESLADGMVVNTLTTYYLEHKFHLAKSTLGDIVSVSYFLAATSTIFAGPLAKRLGLVNTMVFTHLPSSAAVLFFPLPRNIGLTIVLFFIRIGLNNMDQAPRAAFIAAVVKPEERTAIMGITGMLRTLANAAGPSVTGVLSDNDRFWIAFVVAGSLRICYDLGLFALFVNMKLYEHEVTDEVKMDNHRQSTDEEELTGYQRLRAIMRYHRR